MLSVVAASTMLIGYAAVRVHRWWINMGLGLLDALYASPEKHLTAWQLALLLDQKPYILDKVLRWMAKDKLVKVVVDPVDASEDAFQITLSGVEIAEYARETFARQSAT